MTPFEQMHPLIQAFTKEALRPCMLAVAELEPGDLADLRQMLVGAAKGTIDIEMDKRLNNKVSPQTLKNNGVVQLKPKKIIT